jgi:protein-S-isoprenylcysteine O-methyltransferase Ste14
VTRSFSATDVVLQVGNFFFRWRSYLPLALVPVIIFAIAHSQHHFGSDADLIWEIGCTALAAVGLGVRVVTIGQAPRGTSGRNTREQKAATLNTTGAYSVVRHPLYLGNALIAFGFALFPHSWMAPPAVGVAVTVYYALIAKREEQFLRERFGEAYLAWAARVPAIVPVPWRYVPSPRPFSWRTVARREFYGLTVVLVAPFIIDVLEDLHETGTIAFEPLWTITAVVGAAIFLALRVVKKNTDWLR